MANSTKTCALGAAMTAFITAAVAATAQAQMPAAPATAAGLLAFPNVTVAQRPDPALRASVAGLPATANAPLRAYVDTDTGALTSDPTPAQVESLQSMHPSLSAQAKSAPKATLVTVGKGVRWARLDRSRWSYMTARRGAGSDVELACVDGDERVDALLEPTASTLQDVLPAKAQQ